VLTDIAICASKIGGALFAKQAVVLKKKRNVKTKQQ
jgi:hypothetical protein